MDLSPPADPAVGAPMVFSVGYHSLHPDVGMNFQANRWFGWVGEPAMLEEMRLACARIASFADWKREFLALADEAARRGHVVCAGYYWRSAGFFMQAADPDRKSARTNFLAALRSRSGLPQGERHAVRYADGDQRGLLPAYRFKPAQAKCTIVVFGGFDSYIEELTPAFIFLRDAGFDVIAFEGPGQGGALEDARLPMTADWHKPVSAVLDHFGVTRVALVGLSLGGCLVMRAAAFEPRVAFVVAYDILTDFFDVNLRQTSPLLRGLVKVLLKLRAKGLVNAIVARAARRSPIVQWGIGEGMHVTGSASAFDFLRKTQQFKTSDVSALVRQDVLLLAGGEDHYVPVTQWHQQIRTLVHARSVTARLFTRSESAQNHCQVGNYGLALGTIVEWLDAMVA
jgi:alpha-beta hydrolase superfamily lysophospholipase